MEDLFDTIESKLRINCKSNYEYNTKLIRQYVDAKINELEEKMMEKIDKQNYFITSTPRPDGSVLLHDITLEDGE